jgi:hypothetical protein
VEPGHYYITVGKLQLLVVRSTSSFLFFLSALFLLRGVLQKFPVIFARDTGSFFPRFSSRGSRAHIGVVLPADCDQYFLFGFDTFDDMF